MGKIDFAELFKDAFIEQLLPELGKLGISLVAPQLSELIMGVATTALANVKQKLPAETLELFD